MRNNINLDLAKEKGLIGENDELYHELVYDYKYLLEYYLNSIIDFSKYENAINNSNLYIGKNAKYQHLNEFLKLDYLFFINNLFVEKLDKADIDLILAKFNKENISNELIEIVKRTFKEVIRDNFFKGEYTDQVYNVCYGDFVPFNFADNDSMVFRFYYGKNLIELNDDEFLKLHQKQLDFIHNQMDLLKKDVSDKLGVKCTILVAKDIY